MSSCGMLSSLQTESWGGGGGCFLWLRIGRAMTASVLFVFGILGKRGALEVMASFARPSHVSSLPEKGQVGESTRCYALCVCVRGGFL